jgi:hypothetical protein
MQKSSILQDSFENDQYRQHSPMKMHCRVSAEGVFQLKWLNDELGGASQ